jgi:cytochrome c-type biogenesis protein CcmH
MIALLIAAFATVVLALAFVLVPLLRNQNKKGRAILAAALALFLLGIGSGTYWMLGQPQLALRDAQGLKTHDIKGLVPFLIARVRKDPNDAQAWRYLGQLYMATNDPGDAAKALARAITIQGKGDAALDNAYGVALMTQESGTIPPPAEAAFTAALAVEPKNVPARFYLGTARLQHGDRPGAIAIWQSLLTDTPVNTPLHQILVDKVAALTAQSGSAPNPQAMVAMLAARLKADPNDALGWIRLMRAYTVLDETDKAKQALATARKTFAASKDAQTAFDTAAKALKLD